MAGTRATGWEWRESAKNSAAVPVTGTAAAGTASPGKRGQGGRSADWLSRRLWRGHPSARVSPVTGVPS